MVNMIIIPDYLGFGALLLEKGICYWRRHLKSSLLLLSNEGDTQTQTYIIVFLLSFGDLGAQIPQPCSHFFVFGIRTCPTFMAIIEIFSWMKSIIYTFWKYFCTLVLGVSQGGFYGAVERGPGPDLRCEHPASNVEFSKELVVKVGGHTTSPYRKGPNVGSCISYIRIIGKYA